MEEKVFYYEYIPIDMTVKFVTNSEDADPIPDQLVPYNSAIVVPENPVKTGLLFKAWCTDEALQEVYDVNAPVLADMTLYASYGDIMTVTFELNGGAFPEGTADVVYVAQGNPVGQPADPEKEGLMFGGWYSDSTCQEKYSFDAAVVKDTTIYARWTLGATVTLVGYDMENTTTLDVATGIAMSEDTADAVVEEPAHYYFKGWFDDEKYEFKHDFSAIVTDSFTIYAKWEESPLYHMVSEHATAEDYDGYDKFAIDFAVSAEAGNVLSFRYRSTAPISFYNVRNGSIKWIYQQPKDSALPACFVVSQGADGWTYVTYTFTEKDYKGESAIAKQDKFSLHFGSKEFVVGDILEVQDIEMAGVPLTVTAKSGDVTITGDGTVGTNASYATIVEGGPYDWEAHTVSFNTNGGSSIDPVSVEFGKKVAKPVNPVKEGVLFYGWYQDETLATPFSFDTPIVSDITLYAKYAEAVTVTFNTNGGSEIESVSIPKGYPVDKPETNPTKLGMEFGGWYEDEACLTEYNFGNAVNANLTIYAKWLEVCTVTLNANYGQNPETRTITVGKGVIDAPKGFSRIGFYFDKWYDDADCSIAHDFTQPLNDDIILYAGYSAAKTGYKFTANTEAKDRWQFRWKAENIKALEDLAAGDVFTFQVKFTPIEGSSAPATFRIRTNENSHVIAETSLGTPVDGWYTVTVVVPSNVLSEEDVYGIQLAFFRAGDAKIQIGDILEIKNVTYNGIELTMTSSTSCGLYPGQKASQESFPL